MQADFDIAIIGAGLVGLATGRALAMAGLSVLIVERDTSIATETSARNSGVIHSGIYYPTGSLKARLCVEGASLLKDYAAARRLPHALCGKLVVAGAEEEPRLHALLEQAQANGVDGLSLLPSTALPEALRAAHALHVPGTGIIDAHALAYALAADFENAGGTLALGTAVTEITEHTLHTAYGGVCARIIINAAGLHAHRLAPAASNPPPIHFAKGAWVRVRGRVPFKQLIYPLPPETGLGVHLTLGLDGSARLGPDSAWVNELDYTVPDEAAKRFAKAAQKWWPDLRAEDLTPDLAGIRPRLAGPGMRFADFKVDGPAVHGLPWLINLFGIESPGLTACMALGNHVAQLAQETL